MFELLTQQARDVIIEAAREARELRHQAIGTEHMLLGVLHEGDNLGAQVLRSFAISEDRVRAETVRIVGLGEVPSTGQIPFTPEAKHGLDLAHRESRHFAHRQIGTEHLLLGLLSENDGIAARILGDLDADPSNIRTEVLRALIPDGDRLPPSTGDGAERPTPPAVQLTPGSPASRVLWHAFARSIWDGSSYVEVEHLLLALIDDAATATWLRAAGVDPAAIRTAANHRSSSRTRPAPPASDWVDTIASDPVRHLLRDPSAPPPATADLVMALTHDPKAANLLDIPTTRTAAQHQLTANRPSDSR